MLLVIVFAAVLVLLFAEALDVAANGLRQSEFGRALREMSESRLLTSVWWSLNPRRRQSWFSLLHLSFGLIAAALVRVVAEANAYTTGFASLISVCLFML